MKKILSLLTAAAVCAVFAAWSGNGETAAPENTANMQNGSENGNTPVKDSVVIAIGSEPETLDPTKGWGHGNSPIIQSTLVKYTADLAFENDLATSYELSPDGLTWTFTLRDDVTFSDGERLTAQDAAFTLNTAKAAQGSVDLTYMEKAEAADDATLAVTLSKPTSVFLNTIASVGIVPEHAYNEDYGRSPIGSGPYKLVEWKPGKQIMFTANESYYGNPPKIKNVTVVFMSEDASLAAVKAGQAD
ncbi:MAG: ABC transporter substrate-binding protein, partial [Ruminococcus sp.]|nr:ABC transporter substrate-binding protein [Ruminococcus sp.]